MLLESGDEETLRLWQILVTQSIKYFDTVYAKLGVLLTDDDVFGESFYHGFLPEVVAELDAKGLLVVHEGARCSSRRGSPTAVATDSRSSSRSPTAATATRPPTSRPSATGWSTSASVESSMWSASRSPSTSRCASPWRRWPGG